jgi:NAD(P)-dependent dehydrogenase (short-subunit alcohol dehydrogenase family)
LANADLSSLAGKRVLVTGPARGIGAALAQRLAACGAKLALVGLEPETLARVAERCGEGTFVGECDVSDREAITTAVDAAAEALGGLDVVVANAGIATGAPLRLQDARSWERVIEINLLGVMYTDRAALPHLERSHGYLLNVASAAAALRTGGMSAYCAAKAGVEALSDCLRIEAAPTGIDVGVAYFLYLDTDMVRDAERELPVMSLGKERTPGPFGRTYPLAPAIEELAAGIAQRRRRIAYPKWFLALLPLRQLFASRLVERQSAKAAAEVASEYQRASQERGSVAAAVTERTRDLAGL